ncbi:MAG: MBL fold metallo-hydrolase [Smithella sp.]
MFRAFLINDPTGDPGVYIDRSYRREAFLFDLGDLRNLPPRKILKIKYIFVSHTHIDHFIGFDHLLRICLGRDQHISMFGPPGFLANVEGKLGAYTWNLVKNYTNNFELTATEIHENHRITKYYRCRNAFLPENEKQLLISGSKIIEGNSFIVNAVFLDHIIPCLAFSIEEKKSLNIMKNVLAELGLPTGAWLTGLKEKIIKNEPEETPVRIWWKNEQGDVEEKFFPLGILQKSIVKITEGRKVCYITDAVWSESNVEKMVELAKGAELLFIEAPFLDQDVETAARKHHLTARQAGTLAAMAGVKRFSLFHFSPKYKGMEEALQKEALKYFGN